MELYKANVNLFSKKTSSPKALGFFFILFGAAFVLVAGVFFIKNEVFKKNAVKTTGVVVENVKSSGSSGYKTRYSYFDEAGNEYFYTGSSSSNPPEFEVGTELTVYYSKDNPEKSIYESKTVRFIIILFSALGGVSLIAGIIVFVLNRKKEIVWEESGVLADMKKKRQESEEE